MAHPAETKPQPECSVANQSTEAGSKKPEVSSFTGSQTVPNTNSMLPMMHPMCLTGCVPLQNQEQVDHGPGIYAVPIHPNLATCAGLPSNCLIPLTYNIPTRTNPGGVAGVEQGQQAREQQGPHRQVVVRRFQFAIHLDLFLILKLVAVVVLFNQDGSRQRLLTLLSFALFVYLHQTGVFAPLVRWLRQQAAPPQPQPAVRADNDTPVGREDGNAPRPEGHPVAENQNAPVENADGPVEHQNQAEAQRQNGANWFGIVKEIQMFVVGFLTSLLPGFHQHDD